jgi:hypothetical protein
LTVSGLRSDFALFPEFFGSSLMADFNHLSEAEAIRAKHTEAVKLKFKEFAISLQHQYHHRTCLL